MWRSDPWRAGSSSDRKVTESRSRPNDRILRVMSVHDPSGAANSTGDGASRSGPHECVQTLESCAFIWFFDLNRRRFRRVPVGAAHHVPVIPAAWTDYFDLQIDEDPPTFRVSLSADRTSVLRSSYHAGPCSLCGRRRARRRVSEDVSTSGSEVPASCCDTVAASAEAEGSGRGSL